MARQNPRDFRGVFDGKQKPKPVSTSGKPSPQQGQKLTEKASNERAIVQVQACPAGKKTGNVAVGDVDSRLRLLFLRCDHDGDGYITREDIIQAVERDADIGWCLGIPARIYESIDATAELERWFDGINMHRNRKLSWPEFCTWLQHHARVEIELKKEEEEEFDPNCFVNQRISHRNSIEAELERRLQLSSTTASSPRPEEPAREINSAGNAAQTLKSALAKRAMADMLGDDADYDGVIQVLSQSSDFVRSSGSTMSHQGTLLKQLGSLDAAINALTAAPTSSPPALNRAKSLPETEQSCDAAARHSSKAASHEERRNSAPNGYVYTLEDFFGGMKRWTNPDDMMRLGSKNEPESEHIEQAQIQCNGCCDVALDWQTAYEDMLVQFQVLLKAFLDLGQRSLHVLRGTKQISGWAWLELLEGAMRPCTNSVSQLSALWAELNQELKTHKADVAMEAKADSTSDKRICHSDRTPLRSADAGAASASLQSRPKSWMRFWHVSHDTKHTSLDTAADYAQSHDHQLGSSVKYDTLGQSRSKTANDFLLDAS